MNDEPERAEPTQREWAALRRWQHRMVLTFGLAMALLLSAVVMQLTVGLPRAAEVALGVFWLALMAYGFVLQFSARCPNCGARLGFQSRLLVPPYCMRCKIPLRPPKRH